MAASTENNLTTRGHEKPDEQRNFVVGSLDHNSYHLGGCPHAGTLAAWHDGIGQWIIAGLNCRRWGCKHCGPRRAIHLAYRVERAEPTRFITLTSDPKQWTSPRECFDRTRRLLPDFWKKIRKNVGPVEYLRVLELHKNGFPHYHFLARSRYIPQPLIKNAWAALTGAIIVDVRRIWKEQNVFRYMMKYLTKITYIPWTDRRVSWSRNFMQDRDDQKPPKWPLLEKKIVHQSPAYILSRNLKSCTLVELSDNAWVIVDAPKNFDPQRLITKG